MAEYGYDYTNGGLLTFQGVLNSGKEITQITVDRTSSPRTCKFTFADGYTYTLSAVVEETGGTATITEITEEWGEPSV